MSSMRLVGIGFVLAMALLPAMLLAVARGAPAASGASATVDVAAGEDKKVRAWHGDAKPVSPLKDAAAAKLPEPSSDSAALVELYLPDADAAAIAMALGEADPKRLVLSFGPGQEKGAAGKGVDPFVPVEAGKRRRDYGRALGRGPVPVGPVIIASPEWSRLSEKPTGEWMSEHAAAASAIGAAAELTLGAHAAAARGDERALNVEFAAKVRKAAASMSEDAVLSLFVTEPAGAETGSPLRVVLVRTFKLPKGSAGNVELKLPTGSRPTRLVGVLQHGKTMRVLDTASAELK